MYHPGQTSLYVLPVVVKYIALVRLTDTPRGIAPGDHGLFSESYTKTRSQSSEEASNL